MKRKTKPGRPRVEAVHHVLKISDWDWDVIFGVRKSEHLHGPFDDFRHLRIRGSLLRPKKIAAKAVQPELIFFPEEGLTESGRDRIKNPRNVGMIESRGKHYHANLFFPADALGPILQMLIAGRYRYVTIEAGEFEGGYAEITSFHFGQAFDEDDLPKE